MASYMYINVCQNHISLVSGSLERS